MYIIFIFIVILVCFIGMFANTYTSYLYAPSLGSKPCDNLCPNPGPRGVQYNRYEDGTCEILCMDDLLSDEPILPPPKPGSDKPKPGGGSRPPIQQGGGGSGGGSGSGGGGNPGGIKCPPGQISNGKECVPKPDKPKPDKPVLPPGFDISKCKGLGMDECAQKLEQPPPYTCPPGYIIQNNMCIDPKSLCLGGTTWDVKSQKCVKPDPKCPPGYILNANKECVRPGPAPLQCPLGSMIKNGKCEVVSCNIVGQTVQNGQCVCPPGQIPKNGVCSVGGPQCPSGQQFVNGKCVSTLCPDGLKFVNGKCEASIQCPSGQQLINGKCVASSQCPSGQQFVNGKCVCPTGTFMRGNVCVLNPCPTGQIRQNGKCVPGAGAGGNQSCPTGQIRNSAGKCVPKPVQPCPAGQIRNASGQCVTKPTGGSGGIAAVAARRKVN